MFLKKATQPSHFRRLVAARESWDDVWKQLQWRPQAANRESRRQSIDAVTRAAFTSSYALFAIDLFDSLLNENRQLIQKIDEEVLLFECLVFASSLVCNRLNPDEDTHEIAVVARQSLISSFHLMSLLRPGDIEDTALARIDLYDKCSKATDRQAYLCDIFSRIVQYLLDGEHYAHIQIRYEDPPSLIHYMLAGSFSDRAIKVLREMVSISTWREVEEEYDDEDEDEDEDEEDEREEDEDNT